MISKTDIQTVLDALTNLHDEDMGYLTRNKLGGENNHRMVYAREAISILQAALADPSEADKDLIQALTERDEYHDMADKLAEGIALHFDGDIGEHSSSNSPWDRALDLLDSAACAETMRLSSKPEPSEPVGWYHIPYDMTRYLPRVSSKKQEDTMFFKPGLPLFTHPPKPAPLPELSDDEIEGMGFTMLPNVGYEDFMAFAHSILAAAREKI